MLEILAEDALQKLMKFTENEGKKKKQQANMIYTLLL